VCLFTERLPADIPDAGLGGCCDGSAMNGPRACTCWDPVYDQEQSLRLRTDLLPPTRRACARIALTGLGHPSGPGMNGRSGPGTVS
jgi:hypothetical protein